MRHGTSSTIAGAVLKVASGRPTWIGRACRAGIPSSVAMRTVSSSARASSPSAMRVSASWRTSSGACDHAGKAARAAATARSTSAGVPSGMRPATSSVAGLTTSSTWSEDGATQAPST